MKDKKKIIGAISGIRKTLKIGYDLINDDKHLPDLSENDLPILAGQILLALEREQATLEVNEKYAGLSPEQIHEQKEKERSEAVKANLETSAREFSEMVSSRTPEPKQTDEGEIEE